MAGKSFCHLSCSSLKTLVTVVNELMYFFFSCKEKAFDNKTHLFSISFQSVST